MAKVIKLTDNNNVTLLPISDASYIQLSYDGITKSVKDVIIENEEITAAALTELHQEVGVCFNEAGSGLSRNGNTINHETTVTPQTFGPQANKTLNFGDTFAVPKMTINSTGHVTTGSIITYTMPSIPESSHYQSKLYVTPSTLNSISGGNPEEEILDNFTDVCGPAGISGNSYTYISLYEGDDTELNRKSSVWVTGTGSTVVTGQVDDSNCKLTINTVPHLFIGEAIETDSNYTLIYLDMDQTFNNLLNNPSDIPIGTMFSITFNDFEPLSSNFSLGGINGNYPYVSTCAVLDGPGNEITDLTSPLLGYCPDSTITNLYTFTGIYNDEGMLQYITNSNVSEQLEHSVGIVHFASKTQMENSMNSYTNGTIAIIDDGATNTPYMLFDYCDTNHICRKTWKPFEFVGEHSQLISVSLDTDAAKITYNLTQYNESFGTMSWSIPYKSGPYKASTSAYGFAKYDSTPTSGSENALTSGGAYTALNTIQTAISQGADELYVVKFIWDDNNRSWSCNRTYTEISTAWDANKTICGTITGIAFNNGQPDTRHVGVNSATKFLNCSFNSGKTRFEFIGFGEIDNGEIYHLNVLSDNTIALETCSVAKEDHTHNTITAATQSSGTYYLLGTTGNSNLQPKYNANVYISGGTTLRATTFNENGTNLVSKYAPLLKYTVKAASSNAVSFNSSSKMQPNTVYVIGSGSNPFSFTPITSVVLASGSTSFLANDIGMIWNTGQASITNNMTVPMYQMVFKAGTGGVSFTMPSSIRWKDGSAPDSRATASKMCELTIINDIATINII